MIDLRACRPSPSEPGPGEVLINPFDILDKDSYRDGGSGCDTLVLDDQPELVRLAERARHSIHDAIPPNTRRGYEGALRRFAAWCSARGLVAMPGNPSVVAIYMRALADAGRRVATIEHALAAISTSHVRSGHQSPWGHPLVADMRVALRRELGVRPEKKRAADDGVLRRLLAVIPDGLLGVRDRSLLTLGWAGALRRSELVALDVADIRRDANGLALLIRASKTDQDRRGEEVPVFLSNRGEHCPVRSLDDWLGASGSATGAIFRQLGRTGRLGPRLAAAAVADRVQHYAKLAGLDPRAFAGHSLRSGFVTTAARRGRDLDSIMVTTRHRSVRTVREYIQRENLHERGAGEGLL